MHGGDAPFVAEYGFVGARMLSSTHAAYGRVRRRPPVAHWRRGVSTRSGGHREGGPQRARVYAAVVALAVDLVGADVDEPLHAVDLGREHVRQEWFGCAPR